MGREEMNYRHAARVFWLMVFKGYDGPTAEAKVREIEEREHAQDNQD